MNQYRITFYDLSVWIVEGDSSMHVRKKASIYYPEQFVTSVIQLSKGLLL